MCVNASSRDVLTSPLLLLVLNQLGNVVHGPQIRPDNENHVLGLRLRQRIRPQWIHLAYIAVLESLQVDHQVHQARDRLVPDDYLEEGRIPM